MGIPTDVSGGIGGGDYFKLALGQNKILIVGEVVTGYEYWTNEVKRSLQTPLTLRCDR
jgi:hypothetical protein